MNLDAPQTIDQITARSTCEATPNSWSIRSLTPSMLSAGSSFYANCMSAFETSCISAELHPDVISSELSPSGRRTHHAVCNADDQVGAIITRKQFPVGRVVGRRVPLTAKGMRLVGNQLLGGGSVVNAVAITAEISRSLPDLKSDFLLIEDVEVRSPVWNALRRLNQGGESLFLPNGIQPRLKIRLPESMDDYWKQFSSKSRYNLRRTVKLAGDIQTRRIERVDQLEEFLTAARQVSEKSWQAQRIGVRVSKDDQQLRTFVTLANLGLLRCYLLTTGPQHPSGEDRPVAFVIGTQCNGYYSYEEIAYDQEFSRDSPGKVLLIKLLEDLYSHNTPAWLDFGGGDAEYKQTFANHRSRSGNVLLIANTWRGRAFHTAMIGTRCADRMLRSAVSRFGLKTRLRQWFRKRG